MTCRFLCRLTPLVLLLILLPLGQALVDVSAKGLPTHDVLPVATASPPGNYQLLLPLIQSEPVPAPTETPVPAPTPEPSVFAISCGSFPQAASPNWYKQGCVDEGVYEIQRINVSFTQTWCCWTDAAHFAVEIDAQLIQGNADYRIFINDRMWPSGGSYMFGVNPRQGTYSLYRLDGFTAPPSDFPEPPPTWVPLIDWTPSPHVKRDLAVNHLRVERDGTSIHIFVNDIYLASAEDNTYEEGGSIGLYVRNYEPNSIMHFTNMQRTEHP